MRNLKVLGVALAAVFAMSAVLASAASATTFETEHGNPVTLTGNQTTTIQLTIPEGVTTCTTSTFDGTGTDGSTSVPGITPTYSGCKSIGFGAVVEMNGCTYTLKANAGAETKGTADLVCPAGKEITIKASAAGTDKCIIHVEPQTALGTVTYINTGAGTTKEIDVELNLINIKYSTTKGTGAGACTETSTTTGGTLKGTALVTGELEGTNTHEGIFVS